MLKHYCESAIIINAMKIVKVWKIIFISNVQSGRCSHNLDDDVLSWLLFAIVFKLKLSVKTKI